MIIEVLEQKYKCGCNKGMGMIEIPNILGKLNSIIEWDFVKFPVVKDPNYTDEQREQFINETDPVLLQDENYIPKGYIENKKFLGDDPELKPGDVFEIEKGQIVAVEDKDKLVLIVSETGYGALQRIWDEKINIEVKLFFNNPNFTTFEWTNESKEPSEDFDKEYRPHYSIYKLWKDRFLPGRVDNNNLNIKVKIQSEDYFFPVEIYMKDWSILYKSSLIDEDQIEDIFMDILSGFYNNFNRLKLNN